MILLKYNDIHDMLRWCTVWGRNVLDVVSWGMNSEPGGHQPVSKVKLLLNIKANEDYALAA